MIVSAKKKTESVKSEIPHSANLPISDPTDYLELLFLCIWHLERQRTQRADHLCRPLPLFADAHIRVHVQHAALAFERSAAEKHKKEQKVGIEML